MSHFSSHFFIRVFNYSLSQSSFHSFTCIYIFYSSCSFIAPTFSVIFTLYSHICFVFFYPQSLLLFSFFYSYLCLSFSHLFIFTFPFLLLFVIYTYIFSPSFLLTRISSPFTPLSHIFSLSLYSHLFTSLSCSYICIYLSSLFLVSLIRTYRPPLAPPERHRSRLRFISANERFRDELVLEWEQFRRIRTRQRGRGRRTVKSSAKIAPRDCARHSESPERSQRAEFMRFVSIEGRFLCNDTHTSTIAVIFIPVISSNKRIFHFPSIHNDHLISLYFINFRGERKRGKVMSRAKKGYSIQF